jgi:hypothetical protein
MKKRYMNQSLGNEQKRNQNSPLTVLKDYVWPTNCSPISGGITLVARGLNNDFCPFCHDTRGHSSDICTMTVNARTTMHRAPKICAGTCLARAIMNSCACARRSRTCWHDNGGHGNEWDAHGNRQSTSRSSWCGNNEKEKGSTNRQYYRLLPW